MTPKARPRPRLDLRQLECFCAVARTGSFTKAADELGIAQPSLSEQIAKLEQSLGASLFERLSRRIELTPPARAILGKAQALLEDAAALPSYFEGALEGVAGPLRVAAIPTILPYFMTPILKAFAERYPRVTLHVREGTTSELVEHVLSGAIDVALVSLPVEGAGLVMKQLFRDPLLLAVPQGHPLASTGPVPLRKISKERLLILKDGHCLRDETLAVCNRARAQFDAQFEADQFVTIFELIRGGFGVSIVPEMSRPFSQGCSLVPFEPRAVRQIGYIRLERRYVSKALEAFTGFLKDATEERKLKR
ncbi:MAG: hydrogen peroxide-inducible genes activator [Bryobacterales bacterium]|nr:hydrogen peroxide-inducible genes activator [Bryobacterales bacterium]